MMKPIAVVCSDLHLSLLRPACRNDKDWMGIQGYYLAQLRSAANGLPIICAGDIFDRWNAQPELIHFALDALPDGMICIPGQHDLPNHRIEDMRRSGYGVLVKAGKIRDISGTYYVGPQGNFVAHGFEWGREVTALNFKAEYTKLPSPQVAVIHQYMWINAETKYPDAPEESRLSNHAKVLRTYDAVIVGDNHKGWIRHRGDYLPKTEVMNCGGFIRRKSDEATYCPAIGILYEDGTIKRKFLNTDKDSLTVLPKAKGDDFQEIKDFIDSLERLGEHGLDFKEAVKRCADLKGLDQETRDLILRSLEGDNRT